MHLYAWELIPTSLDDYYHCPVEASPVQTLKTLLCLAGKEDILKLEIVAVFYLFFSQTLYRCVLEDICEFPTLEKDLKEFQKLLRRRQ